MDLKTLSNLLTLEEHYVMRHSYFTAHITHSHRHKLVSWMLEVCDEERLTDLIFAPAVNILDRFMSKRARSTPHSLIDLRHLQLLGCVSLFIASKLETTTPLDALKLVDYTDNSIRLDDLLEWEVMVLATLQWDVASCQPNDFIDFFVSQLVVADDNKQSEDDEREKIAAHCRVYAALCHTEFKFAFYPPSMIAAACLLNVVPDLTRFGALFEVLTSIADVDIECLLNVRDLVGQLVNAIIPAPVAAETTTTTTKVIVEDDYELDSEFGGGSGDCGSQSPPDSRQGEKLGEVRSSRKGLSEASNKNHHHHHHHHQQQQQKVKGKGKNGGGGTQHCSYYILTPPQPSSLPLPSF
jgi:cyclin D2